MRITSYGPVHNTVFKYLIIENYSRLVTYIVNVFQYIYTFLILYTTLFSLSTKPNVGTIKVSDKTSK